MTSIYNKSLPKNAPTRNFESKVKGKEMVLLDFKFYQSYNR